MYFKIFTTLSLPIIHSILHLRRPDPLCEENPRNSATIANSTRSTRPLLCFVGPTSTPTHQISLVKTHITSTAQLHRRVITTTNENSSTTESVGHYRPPPRCVSYTSSSPWTTHESRWNHHYRRCKLTPPCHCSLRVPSSARCCFRYSRRQWVGLRFGIGVVAAGADGDLFAGAEATMATLWFHHLEAREEEASPRFIQWKHCCSSIKK